MEQRPFYDFAVEGPVQAEIFVLHMGGGAIRLAGPCGPEAWYVELGPDDDPLDTAARMIRSNVGEPIVVHSTSWRRTRDAVVLSFVAVVDADLVRSFEAVDVGRSDLARNAAAAAPDAIETAQVLEHGLRHLAWLVQDDPVVADELPSPWRNVLSGYVPEPFRHLR